MLTILRLSVVVLLRWILPGSPCDSILEAVLTVSPNRQYLGIFTPTTPAQQGPVCRPILILRETSGLCLIRKLLTASRRLRDMRDISLA